MTYITKTIFVEAQKCSKKAYLLAFHKKEQVITPEVQFLFDLGNYVNDQSRAFSPGAVLIDGTNKKALEDTKKALEAGAVVLHEATFAHENMLVRVDELRKEDGGWHLVEVKSATKVKDEYIWDVSFQWYVLSLVGMTPSKATLRHCSKNKFDDVDITDEVLDFLDRVPLLKKVVEASFKHVPDAEVSEHCFECPFRSQCQKDIDKFEDMGLSANQILKILTEYLEDTPEEVFTPSQEKRMALIEGKTEHFGEELNPLLLWDNYKVLDFEAFHDPLRGYKRMPFLAGIAEVKAGAITSHSMFHEDFTDFVPLAKYLKKHLSGDFVILAFNKSYEIAVLKILEELTGINFDDIIARIEDPMSFVSKGYYHRDMCFSTSLKVLTRILLGKEESYDNLNVKNGTQAQSLFLKRLRGHRDPQHVTDLSLYCERDVTNTALVVERLKERVKAWKTKAG